MPASRSLNPSGKWFLGEKRVSGMDAVKASDAFDVRSGSGRGVKYKALARAELKDYRHGLSVTVDQAL